MSFLLNSFRLVPRLSTLSAASGSYVLTGNAAELRRALLLSAASGSYALTGNEVWFGGDRALAAAVGTYVLTGNDVGLKRAMRLVASAGTYGLTGIVAGLTYVPATGPYLLLETGDRLLLETGDRMLLDDVPSSSRVLSANSGSYALSGQAAALKRALRLVAASGSYALSGKAATLTVSGSSLTALPIDTSAHTPTSDARPGYLVPYTDPMSGVPITRISDDPGNQVGSISGRLWGTVVHHQYMKFTAWNCDESILFIETNNGGSGSGGNTFLDGQTYAPLISRSRPSGWLEGRWDRTDPDTMIYITSGCQLRRHNVMANTTSLIKDFSATYSDMEIGINEGDTSWDGNIVPFNATKISNGHQVGLVYNLATPAVPPVEIDITAYGKVLSSGMVNISPLGNYVLIYHDDETQRIYSTAGSLVQDWTDTETPNHATLTVDDWGEEVAVGSRPSTVSRPSGNVIKRRLSDGAIFVLNPNSYGYHTSASNFLGGLYCVTDYWADSGSPHVSEAALIHLSGMAVGRLCHTQPGTNHDYDNEPHTSLSPQGTRAIFGSAWRGSGTPSRPVGIYIADHRNFYLPVPTSLITNGGFVSNTTGWTVGSGWSRVGSVMRKTAGNTNTLSFDVALENGATYKMLWTMTARSAGSLTPRLAGGTAVSGTARSTADTFGPETIVNNSSGNTRLEFVPGSTFAGDIDNIYLWKV